jgi:hypothetical protein
VGENTRFVYGLGGQLIAEFDGSTGNLKREYLYGGATLITIEPTAVNANGTQYTTSDNLGSPRVITNGSGSVVSRHDYMPFGEELCAGTGGRTTGMGFCGGGDTDRKKFTGYERDSETGLDFAQARYFSSTEGWRELRYSIVRRASVVPPRGEVASYKVQIDVSDNRCVLSYEGLLKGQVATDLVAPANF